MVLRATAVAGVIAALVLGAPATAGAKAKSGSGDCPGAYVVASDAASIAKASTALLCLVNRERSARGISALRPSAQLGAAATAHSEDMIAHKAFSHTGSGGDAVQQRATRAGYDWRAIAEAIGYGAGQRAMPFRLVAAFMRSAEHRAILLDPLYRDLGVGLALGAPVRKAPRGSSTLTLVVGSS